MPAIDPPTLNVRFGGRGWPGQSRGGYCYPGAQCQILTVADEQPILLLMDATRTEHFVTGYHATSAANAETLLRQGTSGPKISGEPTIVKDATVAKILGKNVGDQLDYEPGRGTGSGIYFGPNRHDLSQYGDHILQVQVPRSAMQVAPERRHRIPAGMTPEKSFRIGDGYTEHLLGPEQFSRVK